MGALQEPASDPASSPSPCPTPDRASEEGSVGEGSEISRPGGTPEEAAVRVGGEIPTPESACSSSSSTSSSPAAGARVVRHQRSNSFQRWKRQMQRAWRWGSTGGREVGLKTSVNLEVMANQKRQWYQIHSKTRDHRQHKEPTSLFEHFFVVGLHSYANIEAVEDAFVKRKTWESVVAKSEYLDLRKLQYHGHEPALEPQILFMYPPGKRLAMREKDLPAFCFPGGVKARLLERTLSMSDLNEVVFGQEHLARDDLSFIFCLKVSDNATLYGVCLHVQEIVQREPSILGAASPLTQSPCKSGRFLVSAPRCYCILTRVPFFELHYEMLNSLIAQERLERITQFITEMSLTDYVPQQVRDQDQMDVNLDPPNRGSSNNFMGSAIPVESFLGLTAPSSGLLSEKEASSFSFRAPEPPSPESAATSEASDVSYVRELDKDTLKTSLYSNNFASESSDSRCDSFERVNESYENGQTSPTLYCSINRSLEHLESLESVCSSVRDMGSDCDDDKMSSNSKHDKFASDKEIMEWAKAHNNEALQIVCGYHSLPLPRWGSEIIFHPLEHLQPVKYSRPGVSALGLGGTYSNVELSYPSEVDEVNARLAAAEEAFSLSIWTTATVCRALSLQSVLTLFTGALLEKQMVVICPNLGILSATVLSLIPMIRPFEWQSLLLPVLPGKMLDFLDAPVPFIVGIQNRPADLKIKTRDLIWVDVCNDQVKMCSFPPLPRYRELISELSPIHARLSCENYIAKRHPIYKCSEIQVEAAGQFLNVLRSYLESLCSNLRSHTITSVQSNNDRVSLLLKESYIGSFPTRDRPFVKHFVDTQLFSVLSDSRLSSYENEPV